MHWKHKFMRHWKRRTYFVVDWPSNWTLKNRKHPLDSICWFAKAIFDMDSEEYQLELFRMISTCQHCNFLLLKKPRQSLCYNGGCWQILWKSRRQLSLSSAKRLLKHKMWRDTVRNLVVPLLWWPWMKMKRFWERTVHVSAGLSNSNFRKFMWTHSGNAFAHYASCRAIIQSGQTSLAFEGSWTLWHSLENKPKLWVSHW